MKDFLPLFSGYDAEQNIRGRTDELHCHDYHPEFEIRYGEVLPQTSPDKQYHLQKTTWIPNGQYYKLPLPHFHYE